jgi:hypothetical protein
MVVAASPESGDPHPPKPPNLTSRPSRVKSATHVLALHSLISGSGDFTIRVWDSLAPAARAALTPMPDAALSPR